MITIPINQQMKDLARQWSDKVLSSNTVKNTQNYTNLSVPDRYYIGYLGEIALWRLLHENKKKYVYEPTTNGKSDSGDFFVFNKEKQLDIDIKVSDKSYASKLLVGKAQYNRKQHDYYIGGKIVDNSAEIYGYCTSEELINGEETNYRIPSYAVNLTNLHPIEDFLLLIDNKKDGNL